MVDLEGLEPPTKRSATELQARKLFKNIDMCRNLHNKCWYRFYSNRTTTFARHNQARTPRILRDNHLLYADCVCVLVRCGVFDRW